MPLIKKLILACSVVFTFQSFVICQVIPDMRFSDDAALYEKLYLHIDRELYSPGDDIWFKSYLVDGTNNRLIAGLRNIYVQLIAEDGQIIDQRLMLSFNGVSNNDFKLSDTLPKGQYIIRGFTRYLQNFGEESLFHQKIAVSGATDLPDYKSNPEEQNLIDVSFLPEGGNLVMNTANYIAFKAINEEGKGIPLTGKIVDEAGETITQFTTKYKGMGMFVLMAKEGKEYHAWIDGYPEFTYQFEDAKNGGIALHYCKKEDNLQFIFSQDIKSPGAKSLTLAVSHGGEELFREEFEMTGFQYPVEMHEGFFPRGISKITVFDSQNDILAERLVFVQYLDEKTFRITSDKNVYQPREKVTLNIESLLNPEEDKIDAGLSVAVVNNNYFSGEDMNQTIESYLHLDSELKGSLESPFSCFIDEADISAEEKLDLVMMVNGWRKYLPDEWEDNSGKPLPRRDDVGLRIKGELKTLWTKKPVKGGIVELGPFSDLFLILKDTTDENGQFNFNRLFLKDSALIMINAKKENGENKNVEIFCESYPVFDSVVPVVKARELNGSTREIEIPEKFERSTYHKYLAENEFKLEEGSILIKEVEVKAELKSPPSITGVFGFIDRSFTPTDADRENYRDDFLKYIEFEIPGIVNDGDGIRIGLAKQGPLIFVDGYVPAASWQYISMDEIAKVEIISPAPRSLFEVTGWGAPGGVVSILTKTGFGNFNAEFKRKVHGRVTPFVRGFRQAREFYSPKYPLVKQDSIEKPDQRPTLYWSPDVTFDKGEANIEYYTSDMLGSYFVILEGITKSGDAVHEILKLDVVASDD